MLAEPVEQRAGARSASAVAPVHVADVGQRRTARRSRRRDATHRVDQPAVAASAVPGRRCSSSNGTRAAQQSRRHRLLPESELRACAAAVNRRRRHQRRPVGAPVVGRAAGSCHPITRVDISATHGTASSRPFHTMASPPPGAARGGSRPAPRGASNQWNAWATVTASTDCVGERDAPRRCRRAPRRRAATRAAVAACPRPARPRRRRRPVARGAAVNLPVPAARSHTRDAGPDAELVAAGARPPPAGYAGTGPLVVVGASLERLRGRVDAPASGSPSAPRPRSSSSYGRSRPGAVVALPHHHLAPEVADLLAALVDALGLDGDDAAVALRRRLLVEHPGLGVDRVAVEGRACACCSVSTSRLAIADPLTSGTLMPSTSEYTRLPTTTFLPCGRLVLGEPRRWCAAGGGSS